MKNAIVLGENWQNVAVTQRIPGKLLKVYYPGHLVDLLISLFMKEHY